MSTFIMFHYSYFIKLELNVVRKISLSKKQAYVILCFIYFSPLRGNQNKRLNIVLNGSMFLTSAR